MPFLKDHMKKEHSEITNLDQLVSFITYKNAIPHWLEAVPEAAPNRLRPTRAIVGVIVNGPINLSNRPSIPENPITTWNMADTMIAP